MYRFSLSHLYAIQPWWQTEWVQEWAKGKKQIQNIERKNIATEIIERRKANWRANNNDARCVQQQQRQQTKHTNNT